MPFLIKLESNLFQGDAKLEKCLLDDSGRINGKLNSKGPHVTKIQSALEQLDDANLETERGTYGSKTAIAVKKYKNARNVLKSSQKPGQADDTVGKGTIGRLDDEMSEFEKTGRRGGGTITPVEKKKQSGAALARLDVPLATRKVDAAILKLTEFAATLNIRRVSNASLPVFDRVTLTALNTHFRLGPFDLAAVAPRRPVTPADVAHLLLHYGKIKNIFSQNATTFTDGSPVGKDGKPVAAAANLNSGKIIFGSHFRDFTDSDALRIGPNSRAAVLIHEGFHAVDVALKSGDDDNVHISEFSPKYDKQSADNSLFNPSSYAGFAAHVIPPGKDPNPRFGLGPGRFL